jgi:hypothetical protein
MTRLTCPTLLLAALAACSTSDEPAAPVGLDARAALVRASLDVRGARPTADELARVDADSLPAMLDELVTDPRLGRQLATIYAEALRTRRDEYTFSPGDYGLGEEQDSPMFHAISEEAPHLVDYVTVADLPLSEIVTADYSVVDPILLQIWPLVADDDQPDELPPGTVLAHYDDGRPAAGILATNAFYWRHTSTEENANRGRTNALSRAFLCEDYLDRPIDFPPDIDLADTESIHHAIATNQACQACHATLDPVASHMWPFVPQGDDALAATYYQPEYEDAWEEATGATPAWFGTPTGGHVDDLGRAVAGDSRFVSCAVKRAYEAFLGRPAELEDEGQLALHREVFVASGLRMRALVRSILDDPAYRGVAAMSVHGGVPAPVVEKLATPEILAGELADLSGYAASLDGRSLVRIDYGLRALAGGSERGAVRTPSAGHTLTHLRLAEASARALLEGAADPSPVGALLDGVDRGSEPSGDLVAALGLTIRSRSLEPAETAALLGLWRATHDADGPDEAWTALLVALFADPDLAIY